MCDTFVALAPATADGSVIFGKNSDREPNEAQVLEYHPGGRHRSGAKVACTYLEIPQARETLAVLLSRPFWMWGAEMGANEKGVVVGNEAVWTRMPLQKEGGLTGMDLVRLALERAGTAAGAVETLVGLLADHGQGGICGYEDRRMVYHNSFLVADPREAWVLETAGWLWAAVKVNGFYSLSNGLTIGKEFDEGHPDLIETARKKGWLKKGRTFDFARVFSDWFFTTFSASRTRRARSFSLVSGQEGRLDVPRAFGILRDHQARDYRPDSHLLADRLCAHAANRLTRNTTQSTGSLVAHLAPGLQTYWATGTAAPCLSVFKPIWFQGQVLPDLGPGPAGTFNPETLWWRHERLHRAVLLDYQTRSQAFVPERDALEGSFLEKAAFQQAGEATGEWTRRVEALPVTRPARLLYRLYWQRQNQKAGLRVG